MNGTIALPFLAWLGLIVITWGLLKRPNASQLMASPPLLGLLVALAFGVGIFLTFVLLYHQP